MFTITLTEDQARGLAELIDLAERGHEDFQEQAAYGDYSEGDQRAAAEAWRQAQAIAVVLRSELGKTTENR